MKTKKDNKTELIKFRITKAEKEKIIRNAESENKSLSCYILQKILYESMDKPAPLPQIVDSYNLINEIHHRAEKSGNKILAGEISSLFQKYTAASGKGGNA